MLPDYKNYSIEQLIDARDHVDKTAFPDRYELIISELSNRKIPVEQGINNVERNSNTKKIETQFGLVVFRLTIVNLIIVKIAATLALFLFGTKFYGGFVLQEVTRNGNVVELADSPISYFIRMGFYGFLSLFSIWMISFGAKLKRGHNYN